MTIGESPRELLTQLVDCRDLDAVLRLGSPAQLVKLLFGPAAAKTLVEPFGDALVRGLARPTPTLSSIAFALACSSLLDPGRIATVLALDDEGFDLVPLEHIDALDEDLALTIGTYRDRTRRLTLLTTLWHESLAWSRAHATADRFVADALTLASKQPAEISITASPSLSKRETNLMALEWMLQKHLSAEAEMARCVSQGRALLKHGSGHDPRIPVVKPNKVMQRTVEYLRTFARLDVMVRTTGVHGEGHGQQTRSLLYELREPAWRRRRSKVMQLCRLAAFPGTAEGISTDHAATWLEVGAVFQGLRSYVHVNVPDGHVQRRPTPRKTVVAAAADAARFVRLGGTLPAKPKDWHSLVLQLVEPYYVHEALHINAPAWVAKAHDQALPGTDLVVRAPRDMKELIEWAAYMGNCIHSIYGDDVHDGSRVILGLFRGDVLVYNVGVDTQGGTIWEINSRFNNDNVEPLVEAQMRRFVRDVIAQSNRQPTARRRPSGAKETSNQRRRPPRTWTSERVASVGDYLRADYHEDSPWRRAIGQLDVDGTIQQDVGWVDVAVRLQRIDDRELTSRFDTAVLTGHDMWPLLVDHPLHAYIAGIEKPEEQDTLRALINGDERIKLRATSSLFDDAAVAAAWDVGRRVALLRRRFPSLIVSRPLDVSSALQADPTRLARWVAAIMWVSAVDAGKSSADGIRTVVCEFPNADVAASAVRHSTSFGSTLSPADVDPDWSTHRATLGLGLPRCPQSWLRRPR